MTSITPTKPALRWKEVYTQLYEELPRFQYGEAFYTIADVCEKFAVSTTTARRVLGELEGDGLVEKIRRRGTVVRRTEAAAVVRLIVPDDARPDYPWFSQVTRRHFQGISTFAARSSANFDTIGEGYLQSLLAHQADVFGFLVPRGVSVQTIDFLRNQNIPHVFVDPEHRWKGQPHARLDRVHAGYLATRHLLELGHRRLGWITGSITDRNFRDRLKGYRNALHEAGLPFNWTLIHDAAPEIPGQVDEALQRLMALRTPPTAIIAGDDYRAIRLMDARRAHGLSIPEDLSVVGYPNYPESSLTDPPLTVIDACYERVGEAAVKLLVEQMLEGTPAARQRVLIKPELVVRQTTAPVPDRTKHK